MGHKDLTETTKTVGLLLVLRLQLPAPVDMTEKDQSDSTD